MGMVRISYEQMEQLRECKSKTQMPLSRIVAEAVSHWLQCVAPTGLQSPGLDTTEPCKQRTFTTAREANRSRSEGDESSLSPAISPNHRSTSSTARERLVDVRCNLCGFLLRDRHFRQMAVGNDCLLWPKSATSPVGNQPKE
jgi:hypothetical protein